MTVRAKKATTFTFVSGWLFIICNLPLFVHAQSIAEPVGGNAVQLVEQVEAPDKIDGDPLAGEVGLADRFLQAIEHRQIGDDFQAIRLFENILQQEPERPRVRLELATSYFNIGAYEKAARQVNLVLAEPGVPNNVVANSKRFLARIYKQKKATKSRHHLNASLQLAYGHDSNANVGPSNLDINDGIRLSPSNIETEDDYSSLIASFSHRYLFDNARGKAALLLWSSSVAVLAKEYQQLDDSDFLFSSMKTGPMLIQPGKWKWNGFLTSQYIDLGGRKYGVNSGLLTSWTQYFSGRSMTFTAEYRQQHLFRRNSMDNEGDWLNIGAFYGLNLSDNVTLRLGVEKTVFDAESVDRGYHAWRYSLRTTWAFAERWRLSLRVSEKDYRYGGIERPIYEDARKDQQLNHALTVHYTVNDDWRLAIKLSQTHNHANHALHEYKRDRAEIQLRRQF